MMMNFLAPKRSKYRKHMRRLRQISTPNSRCNTLEYGDYGVRSLVGFWMSSMQMEAVRLSVTRAIKKIKGASYVFRVFPHKPFTQKPLQVRMGCGKGDVMYYVATIRPKTIIIEFVNIDLVAAKEIFKMVSIRLPVKVILVSKEKEAVIDKENVIL